MDKSVIFMEGHGDLSTLKFASRLCGPVLNTKLKRQFISQLGLNQLSTIMMKIYRLDNY